jgi:acetolactate synthase-1/2/3 large subunit
MTDAMDLADSIGAALREHGSGVLYGLPGGGNNLEIVGAAEAHGTRFVLTHGETAATIMAAVHAELTGRVTAAVVTRGPGAASAVNGVAQAMLDHQPIWLLSDAVSMSDAPRIAHQWIDQVALYKPVTKWSTPLGLSGAEILLSRAAAVATSPAPGPVHLNFDPTSQSHDDSPAAELPSGDLSQLRQVLQKAKRPAVVVGQGARGHGEAITRLLSECAAPILTTYKAAGVVPSTDRHYAGLFTGARMEAPVLENADVIFTIGLDTVELIPNPWPYAAPVVSLSEWRDSGEYFTRSLEVISPLASALDELDPLTGDWASEYAENHREHGLSVLLDGPSAKDGISPWDLVRQLRERAPAKSTATVDAGAHMLAAMPLWLTERPGQLLISSGLATMGYALPAAVAAAIFDMDQRVFCLTGDGGLGMVLGELETVARLDLPITIVVFNDSTLSLIKLKQRPEGNGGAGAVDYRATDYTKIAAAVGIAAAHVETLPELDRVISESAANRSPLLIDVLVDPSGYSHVMDVVRGGVANSSRREPKGVR